MSKVFAHEEIRALLKGITPGEWFVEGGRLAHGPSDKYPNGGCVTETHEEFQEDFIFDDDAQFIAAAPAIIRQLLDENENEKLVKVRAAALLFIKDVAECMDWRTHDATGVSGPALIQALVDATTKTPEKT